MSRRRRTVLLRFLDRVADATRTMDIAEPIEVSPIEGHVLAMYARSRGLYAGAHHLLRRDLADEALILARSCFEASLRLTELAATDSPAERARLVLGWANRSIGEKEKLLREGIELGWEVDLQEGLNELESQRQKIRRYADRHGVDRLGQFSAESVKNAVVRLDRRDDYWLHILADQMVHGSEVAHWFRARRLDDDALAYVTTTENVEHLAVVGAFAARSILHATEAFAEVLGRAKPDNLTELLEESAEIPNQDVDRPAQPPLRWTSAADMWPDPIEGDYVVVTRASSAARLDPGTAIQIRDVPTPEGPAEITIATRYADEGHEHPVPRELWVDVRGRASSLQAAVAAFSAATRNFGSLIAFSCNAPVGLMGDVHVAFDSTPGRESREFLESFLPDERGLPKQGRRLDRDSTVALIGAVAEFADWPRLSAALSHYQVALQNWFLGGEVICAEHLWIGIKTLTPLALDAECARLGLSPAELAQENGIDPDEEGWEQALSDWCQAEFIFNGQSEPLSLVRLVGDAIESGAVTPAIQTQAPRAAAAAFGHLRESILGLLDLGTHEREVLRGPPYGEPFDASSMRRVVLGRFIGDADDLAPPDQAYPMLRWHSDLEALRRRDDGAIEAGYHESLRVVAARDVSFQPRGYAFVGRLSPGSEPVFIGRTPNGGS